MKQFKHLKKGDRIETELRSNKDRKIRMTGTVISKLKRKDNGKEFLIFKMDGNFIIGGYAFITANEIINLKKLYDESKFFTCRETTQNNVEIHQKTEDEPFSLQ